jgi:PspA-Associated protein
VIVRISTEGQYELLENDGEVLGELDNEAVKACEAGDEQQFHDVYARLVQFVRENGEKLADDRLEGSDLILPPPDVSLEEAQQEFSGEGLIPG